MPLIKLFSYIPCLGSSQEAIQGPLIYTLVLLACTLLFFRSDPIGVVAVLQMAVGDGLADIVGRRYGRKKWPFSANKSYVGSLAFVLGAFSVTASMLQWFAVTDVMDINVTAALPKLLFITLLCAAVELWEVADDNWTVPLTAGLAAKILL